jgi:hypothetical protein
MPIQHESIPDIHRHEPKGISTAPVDTVYAATGIGTGSWKELPFTTDSVISDVSTPSFILIPIPFNMVIQSIRLVLANAITIANSVITVTRSDGAAMGSVNIPFTASAEGTTVDLVPSGNNIITALSHKYIKIATDGGSTTTAPLFISLKCKVV